MRDRSAADRRIYGIEPEQRVAQLAAQDGRCPLCERPFTQTRPPAWDHRHLDGLVRGMLCLTCNQRIGHDHEDAGWYERAADYLRNPPAPDVIGEHFIPGSLGADRAANE